MEEKIDISVVIPIFNEQGNIEELYLRLSNIMLSTHKNYEIIFVDDGSRDKTYELLRELHQKDEQVKVIRLLKNFGQHPAVMAGFNQAKGEIIITLDADLQNPPEEIPGLLSKLEEGYDVVSGWRKLRCDPYLRKLSSYLVNRLVSKLTGVKLKDYGCMLRVYKRRVVDMLLKSRERTQFITALTSWLGVSIAEVEVQHNPRYSGKSKYNFLKLLRMNFDLITGFSILAIQIVSVVGIAMVLLGFGMGVFLVIWRILYGSGPSGTVSFLALIFFLFGVQMVGMGLIGEYIGRIYIQVQQRPYYIIEETLE